MYQPPADVLEKALGIALIAHAGQKDKAGRPTFCTPAAHDDSRGAGYSSDGAVA